MDILYPSEFYKECFLYVGNIEAQIMDVNCMDIDIVRFPQYFMEPHILYTHEAIHRYETICRHNYTVLEYDDNLIIGFTTYKRKPIINTNAVYIAESFPSGRSITYFINGRYVEIKQHDKDELPDISALDIYG